MMRRLCFEPNLWLAPICALLLCACSKKEAAQIEEEKSPAVAEQDAQIAAQLIPPADNKPATATPQQRMEGAIHPQLTMRLQEFIEKRGRLPESIYEFANTAVDSMPPAPAGMKYIIDPADKTIKAVRK